MRSENLLEQRGPGPRQSDDENRIRVLGSGTLVPRKEPGRADLDLQTGILLDDLGPIAAFRSLERIAPLVVAERLFELALILECLAEGKAQMIAIDQRSAGRGFLGAHACNLPFAEAIGLQVGETPISIAEIRAGSRRGVVGLDCFLSPSEGLERMSDR